MAESGPRVLLEALRAERAALLEAVARVDASELWEVRDSVWSVGHLLAHIPPMEEWLTAPLDGEPAPLEPMDEAERDRRCGEWIGAPLERLVRGLGDRREETVRRVRGHPDLARTVETQWGPLSLAQLVKLVYRHDREHRAQLEGWLA